MMKNLTDAEKRRRYLTIFSFAALLALTFFTIYYGISYGLWLPVWFGMLILAAMFIDAVKCRKSTTAQTQT